MLGPVVLRDFAICNLPSSHWERFLWNIWYEKNIFSVVQRLLFWKTGFDFYILFTGSAWRLMICPGHKLVKVVSYIITKRVKQDAKDLKSLELSRVSDNAFPMKWQHQKTVGLYSDSDCAHTMMASVLNCLAKSHFNKSFYSIVAVNIQLNHHRASRIVFQLKPEDPLGLSEAPWTFLPMPFFVLMAA